MIFNKPVYIYSDYNFYELKSNIFCFKMSYNNGDNRSFLKSKVSKTINQVKLITF